MRLAEGFILHVALKSKSEIVNKSKNMFHLIHFQFWFLITFFKTILIASILLLKYYISQCNWDKCYDSNQASSFSNFNLLCSVYKSMFKLYINFTCLLFIYVFCTQQFNPYTDRWTFPIFFVYGRFICLIQFILF